MNELTKFFTARRSAYNTDPKLIDEVIYTPYKYDITTSQPENRYQSPHPATGDLLGVPELHAEENGRVIKKGKRKFDTTSTEAEIFIFEYGTVVIWGMTEVQEKRFLSSMQVVSIMNTEEFGCLADCLRCRKRFEIEKLRM